MKHISCLYRDGLSPAHSQPVSPPLDPNGISGPHVLQQDLPALPKEAAVVAGYRPVGEAEQVILQPAHGEGPLQCKGLIQTALSVAQAQPGPPGLRL